MRPILREDLSALTAADIDALPFGYVALAPDGTIRKYNRYEADLARKDPQEVLGRNFFREVAPCTQVKEFEGRFRELASGGGSEELMTFDFEFRFRHGAQAVRIGFIRTPLENEVIVTVDRLHRLDLAPPTEERWTAGPPRGCSRCEALPAPPAGPGRLYLWFQDPETLAEAREHVAAYGPRPLEAEGLLLSLEGEQAVPLTGSLADRLGPLAGVRLLWIPGDREPSLGDYPRVVPLHRFLAVRRSDWLLEVLSGRRLTSHFQPIVHAADTSRVFGHEALLRGLDAEERPIAPGGLFAAARQADLLFQLDLAARQSAIREAARHGLTGHVFINFTPNAIYNPTYCLRSTVAAVADAGIEPERVIFEVIESEQVRDLDHLERILGVYREAGFRIALDDLGAGYSSLALMNRLRPDYVKLDQELTRGVHEDPYKAVIAEELLALARRLDIRSVAEGIEAPGELAWLRDHGADYVQGYLIARPAAEPATVLPRLGAAWKNRRFRTFSLGARGGSGESGETGSGRGEGRRAGRERGEG